jgi:SAM-dependent methyltransferase
MTAKDRISADKRSCTCENCGSGDLEAFAIPGSLVMWHCRHCDLYQKGRAASAEEYSLPYHDIYAGHSRRKIRTATFRLRRVAPLVEADRPKLLDIGCSLGFTVEAARQQGWDAQGVDVSADAVERCRRRQLNCRRIDGRRLPYADASFDLVTAWHVIEHVTDVAQALTEWGRVLRPGGLLVLETPDSSGLKVKLLGVRYRRFWKPEHVYAFRPSNLIPFLTAAGFEVLPRPWIGRAGRLVLPCSPYELAYQAHQGLLSMIGLRKAFQLVCRHGQALPQTIAFRPAA